MNKILEAILFLFTFFGIILFFLFGVVATEEVKRIEQADQEFSGMVERGIESLDLDYIYEEAQDE